MKEIIVSTKESNQRLDKYLGKYLNQAPKGFIYKMLRKKNIVLNGKKASGNEKISEGDQIKIFLSDDTIIKFTRQNYESVPEEQRAALDIIYEDANIILINKPCGMLSQKAVRNDISLVEHLTEYLLSTNQVTPEDLRTFHPGVCNRLDRNTSGIVAAGKSLAGLQELSEAFRKRTLHKYYRCIVKGAVTKPAFLKGYLVKDEKKNQVSVRKTESRGAQKIETEYRPVHTNGIYTLLEVKLITGKSHQIRSHLASAGHPILGDFKYGDPKINQVCRKKYGLKTQLLHAYRLEFPEMSGVLKPLSGKVFYAKPPQLFETICRSCVGTGSEV